MVECARLEIVLRRNTYGGSNPLLCATKTHAKGAYITPSRVSFSMRKCPLGGVFSLVTLFVHYDACHDGN